MFESHFGLRENPFVSAHQARFVFPSREHQEALAHLRFGIENREPFVLITGEVGTGKTTALYDALSEWQSQTAVALITNSALTRSELIEEICLKFNLPLAPPVSKPNALVQLERHLLALRGRGDRAILILDEAQNLGPELLEEIRLLSNLEAQGEKLLQVFLVGQPELEAKLSRPELRQLRQRIAVHYRIHPLGPEDTERYIHHRVTVAGGYAPDVFPAATCAAVYELTHGIPREINQVCAQGMLAAFVEEARQVLPEHVRAATQETRFRSVAESRAPAARAEAPAPQAHAPVEPPTPVIDTAVTASMPLAEPAAIEPPALTTSPAIEEAEAEQPVPRPEHIGPATDEASWQAWVASLKGPAEAPVMGSDTRREAEQRESTRAAEMAAPAASATAAPAAVAPPAPTREPEPAPRRTNEPASEERVIQRAAARATTSEAAPPVNGRGPAATREWRPPKWTPESSREELELEQGSIAMRWVAAAIVIAVVVIGAVLLMRFGPWAKHTTPAQHAAAPATTTAPSTPAATPPAMTQRPPAQSAPAAEQHAPAQSPASPPAARPAAPSPSTAGTPAATPAPKHTAPRAYTLSVGSWINRDRADAERQRLTGKAPAPVRIVTTHQNGAEMYTLLIGSFPTRAAAEQTASDLVTRGVVDEARVIGGPKK
ncbi:MAG TPA: AAA family ATPase [Gemmatimonadales bacterium]|nr:AAA family ATPase [Gemmatimonadales bacterium]